MPNFVTPFFQHIARCGGESRQPKSFRQGVISGRHISTASVAGYPDAFQALVAAP